MEWKRDLVSNCGWSAAYSAKVGQSAYDVVGVDSGAGDKTFVLWVFVNGKQTKLKGFVSAESAMEAAEKIEKILVV